MSQTSLDQISAIEHISRTLDQLANEADKLELISDDQPVARQSQSRRLATIEDELERVLLDVAKRLDKRTRIEERVELSRLYVNAVLLRLDVTLFYIRWHAAEHYYSESGSQPPLRDDVERALSTFDRALRRGGLRQTPVSYHLLATAFRAWADKLSPEATTSSGWLEAASDVARELRYRYQRYHTRELWVQVTARSPRKFIELNGTIVVRRQPVGIRKRFRLLVLAMAHSLYGMVSGYGLRAGRFVATMVSIILVFAGIYWLVQVNSGCGGPLTSSWLGLLGAALASLGIFTSLGGINSSVCAGDNTFVRAASAVEALAGYLMLGILVSSVWASFHESLTDGSAIRMKEAGRSSTD